jgi:lipopolysaccharide export system protein LptA
MTGPAFLRTAAIATLALAALAAGARAQSAAPAAPATPAATPSAAGSSTLPTPVPSPVATGVPGPSHVHLVRPGTDVDGDALKGNVRADNYTVSGHVIVHGDPKRDSSASVTESDEPYTLNADEVNVEGKLKRYAAVGNVTFVQGSRHGSADTATYDEGSHDLDLIGHASVTDGDSKVEARTLHYNTASKHFDGAGDVRIFRPVPQPAPNASASPKAGKKHRGTHLPIPV